MACPLPKSAGSPPLTRFQNRACKVSFTRLLGCVALIRSTFDRLVLSSLDVMTMSMEELQVGGFTLPALRGGEDVVAFHQVLSMFKVQSTPGAASLLALEQYRPLARDFRMSAESGGPVDPITVIRAARARHLGMASDRRVGMS